MKRVMNLPQLVLGMAFNWGALLGYSAVHGTCNWNVVIPLYAAGICWTLGSCSYRGACMWVVV